MSKGPCRTPHKKRFETFDEASARSWMTLRKYGKALAVYGNCACGGFHLTSGKVVQRLVDGEMKTKIIRSSRRPSARLRRSQKAHQAQIAAWENEGGSYQ